MATYNGERYLRDQLETIVSQLKDSDELIISDDCSEDQTIAIIREFGDPRIRFFSSRFRNPVANFEFALMKSHGDFVFLADQDDLWMENKVRRCCEYLKSYDLVVSDCEVIDQNGNVVHGSFFEKFGSGTGLLKNILKNTYLGCCMAMRRELLSMALPFPKTIPMHDIWLGAVSEVFGTPFFCGEKLVRYRRHSSNATYATERSKFSIFKKIGFRINLCRSLVHRYLWVKTGAQFMH